MDAELMQVGLLMEAAQSHQQLAESALQQLREFNRELDAVVRDEIRRTLVDELADLEAEIGRVRTALSRLPRSPRRCSRLAGLLLVLLAAACGLGAGRLSAGSVTLGSLTGHEPRIVLRRCGPRYRPCVRVQRAAGAYGGSADYFVLWGY